MTVILIAASSAIRNFTEALSFPGLLFIYGQGLIGGIVLLKIDRVSFHANESLLLLVFIGCGFLLLSSRKFPYPKRRHGVNWTSSYELKILQSLWSKIPLAMIFIMFNLAILIIPLVPPYQNADGSPREIQGWYYTIIISTIVLIAMIYHFAIHNSTWSILSLGGVQPEIIDLKEHHETYGNRREVRITTVSVHLRIVYW